tara:strand:+ start:246 stop:506 length:261 start_codon:yes stop_codon:yes gene_type:complete
MIDNIKILGTLFLLGSSIYCLYIGYFLKKSWFFEPKQLFNPFKLYKSTLNYWKEPVFGYFVKFTLIIQSLVFLVLFFGLIKRFIKS